MRFNMKPEDFLKGQLANPGWHPAVICGYEEKQSKPKMINGVPDPNFQQSTYAEVQFKITAGDAKGQIKFQNFSEKAPGFIVPLLEALAGKPIDKTKDFAGEISKEKLMNKTVDIKIIRGAWNGKPKDEIDGYKPYSGPAITGDPGRPAGV